MKPALFISQKLEGNILLIQNNFMFQKIWYFPIELYEIYCVPDIFYMMKLNKNQYW